MTAMPLAPLLARPDENPWKNGGGRYGGSAGFRLAPSLRRRRNRQSGAAFGPPPSEDRAAALALHPGAEPVGSAATNSARLVGSLHDSNAFAGFNGSSREAVDPSHSSIQMSSTVTGFEALESR